MELIQEFPYLSILWEDSCRSVITSWHGGFEGRNLQTGLDAGLDEIKRRGQHVQWIADAADIGVIGERDKAWISQDWFPRLRQAGVQHVAVVQPQSVIARLAMTEVTSRFAEDGMTVHHCASLDQAVAWMRDQEF